MLLDAYLPAYDVRARYTAYLPAPPERVYQLARDLDWSASPLVRVLLKLRGLGKIDLEPTLEGMHKAGFTILAEEPGKELVIGVVGRFWRPTAGIYPVAPVAFKNFARPGFAKAALNFLAVGDGRRGTVLSTETRVQCLGPRARRLFRLYWTIIGPFSGLIRREALRLVGNQLKT